MLEWIRTKFGTALIGGIITLIAGVFVFYGIFSPRSTRGLGEGSVAGTVNGDPISITDFNKEYTRRIEFFKNLGAGKFSEDQLKQFHIKESVFQELARRKLMVQEAEKQGIVASEEELRDKIKQIPAFQKNGQFDLVAYKQVLEANSYTPGSFEKLMRDDIAQQHWEDYFLARVHVSDDEMNQEFTLTNDKRNVKYVLLNSEVGQKGVKVDSAEVQKFLSDPGKVNIAKDQFEHKKDGAFKGKTFDQAKEAIAHDILASSKVEEIRKVNDQLATQILPLLSASKASDAKINSMLKTYGAEVKSTGYVTRLNPFLPGIGEAKDLTADLFAKASPIDPAQGGKAKKYSSAAWTLVAVVTESQKPDTSKLESERPKLIRQISMRKEREFFDEWIKKVQSKAKIDMNPAVVGDSAG